MIKINLLSTELIKKEERIELILLAYTLLFIAVVAAGLNFWSKYKANSKLEYRITQSERELVKYESILKQVETLQATKNILETKKSIIDSLMKGDRVELRNFGVFKIKERRARFGRNPRTGQSVPVPPRKVVVFKSGLEMKQKVK